jgi:hypothetical protein
MRDLRIRPIARCAICAYIYVNETETQMTRKSTPKHSVVTTDSRVVVFGPASKTDCKAVAQAMNKGGRKSVEVRAA